MSKNMTHGWSAAFAAASDGKTQTGLTKREYFAAMAMQGIAPEVNFGRPRSTPNAEAEIAAKNAVLMADLLIAALNEEPTDAP